MERTLNTTSSAFPISPPPSASSTARDIQSLTRNLTDKGRLEEFKQKVFDNALTLFAEQLKKSGVDLASSEAFDFMAGQVGLKPAHAPPPRVRDVIITDRPGARSLPKTPVSKPSHIAPTPAPGFVASTPQGFVTRHGASDELMSRTISLSSVFEESIETATTVLFTPALTQQTAAAPSPVQATTVTATPRRNVVPPLSLSSQTLQDQEALEQDSGAWSRPARRVTNRRDDFLNSPRKKEDDEPQPIEPKRDTKSVRIAAESSPASVSRQERILSDTRPSLTRTTRDADIPRKSVIASPRSTWEAKPPQSPRSTVEEKAPLSSPRKEEKPESHDGVRSARSTSRLSSIGSTIGRVVKPKNAKDEKIGRDEERAEETLQIDLNALSEKELKFLTALQSSLEAPPPPADEPPAPEKS